MALQVVGGAFLGAFFNVLLERIASPEIKTFFETKKLNNKLLKRLKVKLMSVHGVLEDAEGKQLTSVTVKEWLDELKDVAFDADDLFDQINTDDATANKVHNSNLTFLDSCERELGHEIEKILEKLEFLVEEKDVLHLQEGLRTKLSCKTPSSSLVEESGVFGRDGDREEIFQMLLSEDPNGKRISVIPIVGMGGIGKTTLAQIVFNDGRVEDKFILKAWVYVSQEFGVVKVTKAILEAITLYASATNDLNSLQLELKGRLNGKKFLIVLDDVWNENYDAWFDLQRPFQYGAQGSKIIVTTRSSRVASIMQTVKPHHLELLSDEDCWKLFARHAFDYEDSSKPNLEKIGRKIVKIKCNGLPLAAKTLGGILRSKTDTQEWDNILKSDIRDISDSESGILLVLRLSYYYLPSHLKQCFAYCSIFPKHYEFEKSELILLWMAENLIQPKGNKQIEEIGEEYFHEFVTRSFFQPSRNDKSRYVMHDLINDLAQFISGKFSIRIESEEAKRKIETRTRHLSIVCKYCLENFESLDKASHLRTFFAPYCLFLFEREEIKLEETFLKLSCLRVLSLSRFSGMEELPVSIGFLRHLRYLDVSKTQIRWFPESICSLYNLQTLKAASCLYLKKLPQGLHNLINLRYLDINDSYRLEGMPPNMGKLKNLQMLSDFIVEKGYGCSINELGQLVELRWELYIQNLQHIGNVKEAKEAKLNNKEYLQRLFLDWGTLYSEPCETSNSRHEKDVLDNLRPHPRNLELIAIYQYMGTEFPNWLGDRLFFNLVSVCLRGCKNCCLMPSLGQLPSLKDLWIEGFEAVVTVGDEFCRDVSCAECNWVHPFALLESLTFVSMRAWENWYHVPNENQSYKAFPHLRCLVINDCPRLTGDLPCDLPFMKEISTRNCPNLDTSQILSRLSPISPPSRSTAMRSQTPSTSTGN